MKIRSEKQRVILKSIPFLIPIVSLFFLMIMPVSALSITGATIELADDNSGIITATYKLSNHEIAIVSSECAGVLRMANSLLGLDEHGTGTWSFTVNNMTQYADMNGQPVLLLHGFYFDRFDWRTNKTLIGEYPRLALIQPDFMPDLITIVWPDGRELPLENVTYIPNMYVTL
ncbi:MAG: hypothetical protein JXA44_07145 [Methanospirillaceae archaeon]|nr:hypothetical protein [Methanospirillaceae archaeon]